MRRRWKRTTLVMIGAGLIAGCGFGPGGSTEPGATTAVSSSEIPGGHASNDLSPIAAQRFLDNVRLGSGLDAEGQVPQDLVAGTFASGSPIYLSAEVTDAPAGSLVEVALLAEVTTEPIWREQKAVPSGRSYLSFEVDDRLPPGRYRAQWTIGDETVARREFVIVERPS
jgi:hypothetical protein